MRCDGNEPCGPCQSTTSDCHYTASTAPSVAPSMASHAELVNEDQSNGLPNGHGFTASTSPDPEGSQDLSFASQHPNLDVRPALDSAMEGLQTYPNTISLQFQDQPAVSVYDPAATNNNHMSLGEDMMYPLPDGDGMNDFWQMPTMVCISRPWSLSLSKLHHRTASFGSTDLTLPGPTAFSIQTRHFWIMFFHLQCRTSQLSCKNTLTENPGLHRHHSTRRAKCGTRRRQTWTTTTKIL